ncbi:cytochrome P450 [Eremomyces bilateralis CBS 781.70]|uniref:Cytochrome P450 n=1 Tax=Eremomyces bilateralis CBS 781.70 TaxID=1392243 RepID=A0A6G1FS00_9PEZI|nr:cytochrome P450 [Eremomyces bilateralis CBS 781.70]KAF1808449.1 cytochrome P450 [Eremomyces bilateralis CBS 781.70]
MAGLLAQIAQVNSMRPGSVALVAILASLIYLISKAIYNAYFHPLAKFPGPRFRNATPFVHHYRNFHGDLVFEYAKLHKKYGPVVRVGINLLSFNSPGAWHEIYGYRSGHRYSQMEKDPDQYERQPGRDWSILNAPSPMHSRLRKLFSPSFSEKSLRGQEPMIMRYVDLLVIRLKERVGQKVDLAAWMNYTTFDVIGDLAYGESFGCLENANLHPWIKLTFDFLRAVVVVQCLRLIPGALWLLNAVLPPKIKKGRDDHIALTTAKVQKRIHMETSRPDFMGEILETMGDPEGLSVSEMEANSEVLIIAGSETTATLLSGCFYYLLRTPRVYRKLVKEIRGTFKNEADISYDNVSKCRYMTAVLEESLRIYPPIPTSLGRVVPGEGEYIDGIWIPGGTVVGVSHWASYHSDTNFRDPYEFVPERFLGDERYKNDRFDVLHPFSMGPRNCIGKNIAYLEMRLIVARLIWNFEFQLLPESEDWNDQKVYVLWAKGPLHAKISLAPRDGVKN